MAESYRPCPIHGCDEVIPMNHLMCKEHFFQVPRGLRERLVEASRDCLAGVASLDLLRGLQLEALQVVHAAARSQPGLFPPIPRSEK
jgi:hypothetical protein